MKPLASLLVFAAGVASLRAQAPNPLPVFAGSTHVFVLVEVDGTVKTWGSPEDGEGPYLGDGSARPRSEPAPLPGVRGIASAAVGHQQVLLLGRDGAVYAWGRNNACEVGSGDEKSRKTPIQVAGLRDAVQVAAGEGISGAVLKDGTVWMWGSADRGQLGNGSRGRDAACAKRPVRVEGLSGVKKIALDGYNVIALKEDGTVWGWGANGGALGDGSLEPRPRPVQMQGIAQAVDIALAGTAAIVLADGTVRMTGAAAVEWGEVKPGAPVRTTAFPVPGVAHAVSVRKSSGTTIVRLRDGSLLGWGNGYFGVLGDGQGARELSKPHAPTGLGAVLAHYMMDSENFAVRADGTVMAWGIYDYEKDKWVTRPVPVFKVKLAE
ncbi:MAG TPA: hypothetical protein VJ600_05385 [Holophagaceae bacterium]|nr:hypothetical protein [Holophagaceae bacterium]